MAFGKAMPEAFRVTLFNGICDNNESKELGVFAGRVSIGELLENHFVFLFCCDTKLFLLSHFTCQLLCARKRVCIFSATI